MGGRHVAGQGTTRPSPGWKLALAFLAVLPLAGCGSFFQCENKTSCPTSTTGTGTGTTPSTVNFAFVAYPDSSGNQIVAGYDLSGGDLTATNSITLPFVPIAMAVNPANTLLYVLTVPTATNPGIYAYAIGTDGKLSTAFNGAVLQNDLGGAMAMSPDGGWIYTLEAVTPTLTQYQVTSTGTLSPGDPITVLSTGCSLSLTTPVVPTCGIAVSPQKNYVMASFGSNGDAVFTYTSTSGLTNAGAFTSITPANAATADFAVAIDGTSKAYIAQTSTLSVYGLAALVASPSTTSPAVFSYAGGTIPRSPVVDPASRFVYTADVGLGKISGFAIGTTTALTSLAGSPFAAPASVASIGVDSTSSYLVAAGYDAAAGIQLYAIPSSGVVSKIGTARATSTNTQYPVLVAMSH